MIRDIRVRTLPGRYQEPFLEPIFDPPVSPTLESSLMMLQGFSICMKISADCLALPVGVASDDWQVRRNILPYDSLTFEVQRSNWPTIK